jgi:hypothetical protein
MAKVDELMVQSVSSNRTTGKTVQERLVWIEGAASTLRPLESNRYGWYRYRAPLTWAENTQGKLVRKTQGGAPWVVERGTWWDTDWKLHGEPKHLSDILSKPESRWTDEERSVVLPKYLSDILSKPESRWTDEERSVVLSWIKERESILQHMLRSTQRLKMWRQRLHWIEEAAFRVRPLEKDKTQLHHYTLKQAERLEGQRTNMDNTWTVEKGEWGNNGEWVKQNKSKFLSEKLNIADEKERGQDRVLSEALNKSELKWTMEEGGRVMRWIDERELTLNISLCEHRPWSWTNLTELWTEEQLSITNVHLRLQWVERASTVLRTLDVHKGGLTNSGSLTHSDKETGRLRKVESGDGVFWVVERGEWKGGEWERIGVHYDLSTTLSKDVSQWTDDEQRYAFGWITQKESTLRQLLKSIFIWREKLSWIERTALRLNSQKGNKAPANNELKQEERKEEERQAGTGDKTVEKGRLDKKGEELTTGENTDLSAALFKNEHDWTKEEFRDVMMFVDDRERRLLTLLTRKQQQSPPKPWSDDECRLVVRWIGKREQTLNILLTENTTWSRSRLSELLEEQIDIQNVQQRLRWIEDVSNLLRTLDLKKRISRSERSEERTDRLIKVEGGDGVFWVVVTGKWESGKWERTGVHYDLSIPLSKQQSQWTDREKQTVESWIDKKERTGRDILVSTHRKLIPWANPHWSWSNLAELPPNDKRQPSATVEGRLQWIESAADTIRSLEIYTDGWHRGPLTDGEEARGRLRKLERGDGAAWVVEKGWWWDTAWYRTGEHGDLSASLAKDESQWTNAESRAVMDWIGERENLLQEIIKPILQWRKALAWLEEAQSRLIPMEINKTQYDPNSLKQAEWYEGRLTKTGESWRVERGSWNDNGEWVKQGEDAGLSAALNKSEQDWVVEEYVHVMRWLSAREHIVNVLLREAGKRNTS